MRLRQVRWHIDRGSAIAFAVLWLSAALAGCFPAERESAEPQIAADSLARAVLVDLGGLDSSLIIEARYATSNNFSGSVLPGYEAPHIWLRREPAEALVRVQASLVERGYGLKVFDGYRPVRATEAMVRWAESVGRVDLLDDGYIARRSRHNLGVALDLTVVDSSGTELEMGTPYDTFSEEAHTDNAQGEVMQNRLLLKQAMEAEGFVNYDKEWWHYSFEVPDLVPFDLVVTEHGLRRR